MIQIFNKILLYIVIIQIFSYASIDKNDRVDTTITHLVDLTADGINDTIICQFFSKSWATPFKVNWEIRSNGKTILSKKEDGGLIDIEFGRNNDLDWCDEEYIKCKRKWYFDTMWDRLIRKVALKDDIRMSLFDSTNEMSIFHVIKQILIDSMGYSKKKAEVEAKKFTDNLKKREFYCLVFPLHPIHPSFPSLYVPYTNEFAVLFCF